MVDNYLDFKVILWLFSGSRVADFSELSGLSGLSGFVKNTSKASENE